MLAPARRAWHLRGGMATTLGETGTARRAEYVARINRVIDYIARHLDEPLSLAALAKVACFSPHHFHRVFGAMTGETLNGFVQRVRTEKAASMLISHPARSVTETRTRYARLGTLRRGWELPHRGRLPVRPRSMLQGACPDSFARVDAQPSPSGDRALRGPDS